MCQGLPHRLDIIKAHVPSTEGDDEPSLPRNEGLPRCEICRLKTGKVPGITGQVGHPVTCMVSGGLAFLLSLGNVNDLYLFPSPSVSFLLLLLSDLCVWFMGQPDLFLP